MRRFNSYGPSLIVLGTAIVILLAGPSAVWRLTYEQTRARIIQASEALDDNPILQQLSQAYRDIATLVEPSVVHISTERPMTVRLGERRYVGSSGSGWIYDEAGHVVTNYHVIQDAQRIEVQLHNGIIRAAEVVGYDQSTDIAVIKIEPGRLFPALIAKTDDNGAAAVKQGDLVFAFGSPFDFRFSMSSGVVSGIGRSVGVIRDERGVPMGYENFIQVDAAINPGNSGGPLTNARGRVIGMNTAIATGRGSRLDEGQFAGIGLAIPIDMIEPVVEQIIDSGSVQKGFLGVSVRDLQDTIAMELSLIDFSGYGLTVGRVDVNNPAFEAGLELGDVITAINDQQVRTQRDLDRATAGVGSGETVELAVWRYDPRTDRAERVQISLPGVVAANGFRGVWLLELDDHIADWLALLGFTGRGVRISRLELDKPARRAGLRYRDIVTQINGVPVRSVPQLRSKISSMRPGEVVQVKLWRYEPERGHGREMVFDVELGRLDMVRMTGVIPPDQPDNSLAGLGLARIATNTPELSARYGTRYLAGVLVEEVVKGSSLEGRIEPGSVIVAVMDRMVTDVDDFFDLLRRYDLRRPRGVRVTFVATDGSRNTTYLVIE
ncbi:MAG: PDZ domain-containing protein [Planctomycetes bacterium]|nr:PDZ domain-containing protein [Planctomycetota bacterium]